MKKLIFISLFFTTQLSVAQYFTKITNSPISNTAGDSRSVNWVDVNNDGWIDCFISNGPKGGQNNSLFINDKQGNFVLKTNDPIVSDNTPSDGATFADLDNDGDLDCFVVNWYNVNNLAYLNDGKGNFSQIKTGVFVNDLGYSETASFGDYDKDGLIDLYVTNSEVSFRNFLYKNNGNANFTKITNGSLVTDAFYSRSVNWTDCDNDGDLDLFVTNENGQNENFYRNDGAGLFTKLTTGALLNNAGNTISSSWADIDNDGDLDVFLANDGNNNAIFKNNGNFIFEKIQSDTVSKTKSHSFSSAWSDIDNDGDLDLFVTNSFDPTNTKLSNFFYLNDGKGNFTRNITDIIATDKAWSYGCAFGDYDNDGFEDLMVATCRFNNIDQPDLFYYNNSNQNHWLTLNLIGIQSNKSAIGTKIRVKSKINGISTWQMREISAQSSYCGQNDMRAHFGLAEATLIDSLKIEWISGTTQVFTQVKTNQFLTLVEGENLVSNKEIAVENDTTLTIFPNPSTGIITISTNSENGFNNLVIKNLEGKTVASFKKLNHTKEYTIDIKKQHLPTGVYIIMIDGIGKKVIIE